MTEPAMTSRSRAPEVIRYYKEQGYAFGVLTPEVKPVHFTVGKPKWKRSASWDEFTGQLAAVQERKRQWPGEEKPVVQVASEEPPGPAKLEIRLGGKTLELTREQYVFRDGYYRVPLRQLTETMGGTVEWNAERRVAAARYGMYRVEYDLARREVRVFGTPGSGLLQQGPPRPGQTIPPPEMELRGGVLYVPLREALGRMDCGIRSYEAGGDTGVVDTRLHAGFGWGIESPLPRSA
ncbi:copper amine oxidase N-terminal domain-containing protein [Paenibacillus sp. P26]|nr:copper amine oxidase N-terminal domain-containing protein [Paenibacillus sp. P26]